MRADDRERRVLCVDDEETNLITLRYALEPIVAIDTTTSPTEAAEWLTERSYDLLITDQRMPEMSGVELCAIARRVAPDTVRVILTAYADLHAAIDAVNEGAVSRYLQKPLRDVELQEMVAAALQVTDARRAVRQLENQMLRGGSEHAFRAVELRIARELHPHVGELETDTAYLADLLNALADAEATTRERLYEEAKRCVADLRAGVGQIREVYRRLESDVPTPPLASSDVGRVVHSVLEITQIAHQVTVEGPGELFAAIDPSGLGQILDALLRRATYVGSEVTVTFEGSDDQVEIRVVDWGPSLSEADLDRVFDPYAAPLPEGDGRAMALAREIAIAAGGTLSATSGATTTMLLRLPRRTA